MLAIMAVPTLIFVGAVLFYPNRDWLILWPRAYDTPLPTILFVVGGVALYAALALYIAAQDKPKLALLWAIIGGLGLQVLLTLPSEPNPLAGIVRRTYAVFTGGYWTVGATVTDVRDFILHYAERAGSYPVHQSRHPPGLSLIFWLGAQLFTAVPALANPIADALRPNSCLSWISVNAPANQMAAGAFGIVAEIALAMLTLWPLRALVQRLAGPKAALWATLLYPLIPGFGMWVSQFDRGLALIYIAALWAAEQWVSTRKIRWAFIVGLIISVGTFLSFGMAPVALAAALFAAVRIWQLRNIYPSENLRMWLRPIAFALPAALLGLGSVWGLMGLLFGLDPIALYKAVFESHLGIPFPFWPFVLWHPWDPMTFIGLPLVALTLTLGWRKAPALAAAFGLTLLILSLAHVARGETGRVWMFFAPAVVGASAIILAERTSREQHSAVALLALQTAVMALVFRVLGSYGLMPDQLPVAQVPPTATVIDTRFGGNGHIALLAYEVAPLKTGEEGKITLYWQRMSTEPIDPAYSVFVHIATDENDQARVAQDDRMPVDWKYPTTCWQTEQVVMDVHPLPISADAIPGDYPIFVGLDDPAKGQRPPTFASPPAKQLYGSVLLPSKAKVVRP